MREWRIVTVGICERIGNTGISCWAVGPFGHIAKTYVHGLQASCSKANFRGPSAQLSSLKVVLRKGEDCCLHECRVCGLGTFNIEDC